MGNCQKSVESEIDNYVDESYERIRNGDHKVKVNGNLRCKFWWGKKQQYKYNDLLQHASGVGAGSIRRKNKQKADHCALAKYLENNLGHEQGGAQSRVLPQRHNPSPNDEDQLVWPRMGIVVNVSMESESQVLENGYWLEKFARYKIVDVHVLPYQECLKAQVVVKYSSDWNGLAKSAEFEKNFMSQHCSKEDWKGREKDDCNYHPFHGWIAHRNDYDSEGVIREYLRREAQLKTVSGVSQETFESRQTETACLTKELCESNKNLSEWQYKYRKEARNLSMVIQDKDQFHDHIVEETRKLQQRLSQENVARALADGVTSDLESWARKTGF